MTDLGVSHASGLTVYYALSQVHTLSFYAREDGPLGHTPESIAKQVAEARHHDPRLLILIVEGGHSYLSRYLRAHIDVDVRILISDSDTLRQLQVHVIDADWTDKGKQLNINDYIRHLF